MTWVKHNIRLTPAQDRTLIHHAERRGLTRYRMMAHIVDQGLSAIGDGANSPPDMLEIAEEIGAISIRLAELERVIDRILFTACAAYSYARNAALNRTVTDQAVAVEIEEAFARQRSLALEVLAIVMAETLASGSDLIEMLGPVLKVDMADYWIAGAAFYEALRDREVAIAILGEVGGNAVASANAAEKGKTIKGLIADFLTGENGRPKTERWVPRWMRFPPAAYTARGGVPTVANANRARWIAEGEAEKAEQVAAAVEGDIPGGEPAEVEAEADTEGHVDEARLAA